ncbi:GNAT family N-acetyltransferase, partial [Streptomyces alkaliterrae]
GVVGWQGGGMPQLTTPTARVRTSFLKAMREFADENDAWFNGNSMISEEIRRYGDVWEEPEGFAGYVADVVAAADPATERPAGWVPATVLWYVEGDEWLGRLAIRHAYTPHLLEYGGIVGYEVRPSARRRGHATAMLRAALPVAARLGFERVLVTCDHDNTGSRKVIEACGGVFDDQRGVKLRYWVPTGGPSPAG